MSVRPVYERVSLLPLSHTSLEPENTPLPLHLPPELYEAIIDQIDNRATLETCSLVCHLFCQICQQTLFRRIRLGRPFRNFRQHIISTVNCSERFSQLLDYSPHLCAYVKVLNISDDTHLNFYREERSWIRHDRLLEHILPKLMHLKELGISGNVDGNRLNFKAWSEGLKEAIMLKCRSSSLTSLNFNNVRNVPFHLLGHASSLESLNLCRTSLAHYSIPEAYFQIPKPKLKTFIFTTTTSIEWSTFYPWLQEHCMDLTQVSCLSLSVDFTPENLSSPLMREAEISAMSWIMGQCAATMETLDLVCPEAATLTGQMFLDLSTMPRLRDLTLQGYMWSTNANIDSDPKSNLQWLIDALNKIPEQNSLESVSLIYSVEDNFRMSDLALGFRDAMNWEGLVSTILRLHSTTKVVLGVSIMDPHGTYAQNVVEEKLSMLIERGILVLQLASHYDVE